MDNNKLGTIEIGKAYERPWGRYIVLEVGNRYLLKRLEINPGKRFSLQLHNFRTEHWIVVQGECSVTLGERIFSMRAGDSIVIPVKEKHRAECTSDEMAVLIEVQRGDDLREDDIVRFEDDYGRVPA